MITVTYSSKSFTRIKRFDPLTTLAVRVPWFKSSGFRRGMMRRLNFEDRIKGIEGI